MPAAIEEEVWRAGQGITLQGLVDGGRPRVLRGLCRDWPIVQLARQSDEAFAHYLARHDKGAPVDVLRIPPGEDGVVGYNAELTGFNYKHFRVSVTEVLQRLVHYSGLDDPPGLAMQSAVLSTFLPSFAPLHPNPLLHCDRPETGARDPSKS